MNPRVFVVGCTHLDDKAMLKFRKTYRSVSEMNEAIAHRWNSVIRDEDLVYILGDFAAANVTAWVSRLSGNKILILGNHDPDEVFSAGFLEVSEHKHLVAHPKEIGKLPKHYWLTHYPSDGWPYSDEVSKSINVHAHSHAPVKPKGRQYNVSIDARPNEWPVILGDI